MSEAGSLVVISGIPGAGKSTVARNLAARRARAVHLEADMLQRCIVAGGVWPHEEPAEEARRQLRLRGRHAAVLAEAFVEDGFDVILDDIVIGERVDELLADLAIRPLRIVMLTPVLDVVADRDASRADKHVFERWSHLDAVLREQTKRIGLWLDSSDLDVDETVTAILDSWDAAVVP